VTTTPPHAATCHRHGPADRCHRHRSRHRLHPFRSRPRADRRCGVRPDRSAGWGSGRSFPMKRFGCPVAPASEAPGAGCDGGGLLHEAGGGEDPLMASGSAQRQGDHDRARGDRSRPTRSSPTGGSTRWLRRPFRPFRLRRPRSVPTHFREACWPKRRGACSAPRGKDRREILIRDADVADERSGHDRLDVANRMQMLSAALQLGPLGRFVEGPSCSSSFSLRAAGSFFSRSAQPGVMTFSRGTGIVPTARATVGPRERKTSRGRRGRSRRSGPRLPARPGSPSRSARRRGSSGRRLRRCRRPARRRRAVVGEDPCELRALDA
jgi:hypothetical protein